MYLVHMLTCLCANLGFEGSIEIFIHVLYGDVIKPQMVTSQVNMNKVVNILIRFEV
jgi:hypothetical protein